MSAIARGTTVLLGVLIALLLPGASASAVDEYQASVVVGMDLTAECPVALGQSSRAVARVSTDANGAVPGNVRFFLDGQRIGQRPVGPDGRAEMTVPARVLPLGEHTLRAVYLPPSDSNLLRADATAPIIVNNDGSGRCVSGSGDGDSGGGPGGGSDSGGGLLPNTGGFWIGLLVLGLLALAAGAEMIRRTRETA